MEKKELLKLLDNLVEEQETVSSNRYDRVLLIDGLNLYANIMIIRVDYSV